MKIISSEEREEKIECFVYVSNLLLAKQILKEKYEVEIVAEFSFINLLCLRGSPHTIFLLAKQDCVRYISSGSQVSTLVNVSKKALKAQNISYTGKDVGIAYIDTGISPHLDFTFKKNRIEVFVDLLHKKNKIYDDNGHGTFVTGVGSGNGFISNKRFTGFAPNSRIIALKALDEKGEASANKILEAMQWLYTFSKELKIKVVCMSFGSEPLGYNDPIMKGAEMLWRSGLTVVAAAGNSGPEYETIKSPGISSKIITVGGINDNRLDDETFNENYFEIAPFSSRGPAFHRYKPDIVAPSVEINSCSMKNFYTKLSGTSVSTPMIAGLCACAYEKNPHLKPDIIKKLLISSSKPITFNKNYEGYGIINAEKFIRKV